MVDGVIKNHKYDVFGYPIVRDFDFPLIPDIILKEAKENLDYREGYKEWKLLHKYEEVVVGTFRAPKNYKGYKLTGDDQDDYMRNAGEYLRKLVDNKYDQLNKMDKVDLQRILTKYKGKASTYAKLQIPINAKK